MIDRKTALGVLCGLSAATIWGAWPVVSKDAVTGALDPFDIAALRFLVAGLVVSPFVWRRPLGGLRFGPALLCTLGAGAPYVALVAFGLTLSQAGHAGVIVSAIHVALAALGGIFLLGERPNAMKALGLALVAIGVFGLLAATLTGGGALARGDLLFALGGVLQATYTLTVRASGASAFEAVAAVSVLSLVLYLPLYIILEDGSLLAAPLPDIIVQGVFQGLLTGLAALFLQTRAVALLGASLGGVFPAFAIAVAIFLGWAYLGEQPSLALIAGASLTGVGMILAVLAGARRNSETSP